MAYQRRRFTTINQLKHAIVIEWGKLSQRFHWSGAEASNKGGVGKQAGFGFKRQYLENGERYVQSYSK